MNFVALLGWHPDSDQEIFDSEELVKAVSGLQQQSKRYAAETLSQAHRVAIVLFVAGQ
jgi:hypothetical protein